MTTKEIPEEYQWANDLKVGDEVFLECGRNNLTKTKVIRVSKSHVTVVGETKYPRKNLTIRIDAWTWEHLLQVNPETEAEYKLQETRAKVRTLIRSVDEKANYSTINATTIEELLVLRGAAQTVCALLDEVAKRVKK